MIVISSFGVYSVYSENLVKQYPHLINGLIWPVYLDQNIFLNDNLLWIFHFHTCFASNSTVIQVSRPVPFPCFGVLKKEKHVLLASVADIVIEQGNGEPWN